MAEQRDAYDAALATIVNFFAHVTAFSTARGALLSRRPVHLGLENISDPAPAPGLLQNSRLFDLAGRQLWPDPAAVNRLAVEMSQSVLGMAASQDRDQFSPHWWRAAQRRQAAAAAEGARRDENLARMASEERERYLRDLAHGAR
jgi:hypothetical protein